MILFVGQSIVLKRHSCILKVFSKPRICSGPRWIERSPGIPQRARRYIVFPWLPPRWLSQIHTEFVVVHHPDIDR